MDLRIPNTRILVINGMITDDMCCSACISLLEMESESTEDITILLNSPGGSVQAGFMLIDTMGILSADVEVICTGLAASMGAMILMAGTRGKRKALEHARIMLHQPLGGVSEMLQVSDFEIQSREMQRTRREIFDFISRCTGKSYESVASDCDRNFW
nr:ATP-dependent Clp protease proteolytic subunit [Sphaerochaetaceae bacterium]